MKIKEANAFTKCFVFLDEGKNLFMGRCIAGGEIVEEG
jgi:hypothetical protein